MGREGKVNKINFVGNPTVNFCFFKINDNNDDDNNN